MYTACRDFFYVMVSCDLFTTRSWKNVVVKADSRGFYNSHEKGLIKLVYLSYSSQNLIIFLALNSLDGPTQLESQ